jgi:hypothetical protein
MCNLELHPNWVILQLNMVNVFNLVSRRVIFQELHVVGGDIIQLIPFVYAFYVFELPLFYSHHNCYGNVMVIPFSINTYQYDPLGGALFTFIRFRALHSTTSHFPSYLFPSTTNDIHVINPPSIVSFAYEHFHTELHAIGFSVQFLKCVTWSPFGLRFNFEPYFSLTHHQKELESWVFH